MFSVSFDILVVVLTGILLPAHIWARSADCKPNFPPIDSIEKPLAELVTPSPWPGGPKFKPQLHLMMSPINDRDHGFNPRGGEMHQLVPV